MSQHKEEEITHIELLDEPTNSQSSGSRERDDVKYLSAVLVRAVEGASCSITVMSDIAE